MVEAQIGDVVLQTINLSKQFKSGEKPVYALRDVSFTIERGEFVGIVGPSGSGKSTLLGIISGLDSPTSGTVIIDGQDITKMRERKLTRIRNEKIGFVFQSFNLIPTLSALENVALPVQFSARKNFNPNQRAKELLTMLGLKDRINHRPTQLSGGQQQRVAIARALANNPAILVCDEPTGNLDTESSQIVINELKKVQNNGTTVIVVTHDSGIADQTERLITLVDGQIISSDVKMATGTHFAIQGA